LLIEAQVPEIEVASKINNQHFKINNSLKNAKPSQGKLRG